MQKKSVSVKGTYSYQITFWQKKKEKRKNKNKKPNLSGNVTPIRNYLKF